MMNEPTTRTAINAVYFPVIIKEVEILRVIDTWGRE